MNARLLQYTRNDCQGGVLQVWLPVEEAVMIVVVQALGNLKHIQLLSSIQSTFKAFNGNFLLPSLISNYTYKQV